VLRVDADAVKSLARDKYLEKSLTSQPISVIFMEYLMENFGRVGVSLRRADMNKILNLFGTELKERKYE